MAASIESAWSDASSARLRELHDNKFSFSVIASMITSEFGKSISRNAAIGRAHRMGLDRRVAAMITVTRRAPPRPRVAKPKIARPASEPELEITEIELRQADVEALQVSLIDLEFGQCRYPYGDGPFTFCALPAFEDGCYCAAHFALTHSLGRANEPPSRRHRVSKYSGNISLEAA